MAFNQIDQNVFKAAKVRGRIYLAILVLVAIILFLVISIRFFLVEGPSFFLYFLIIGGILTIAALVTIDRFYGIKYILAPDALIIKHGLLRKVIPYGTITNVEFSKDTKFQKPRFFSPFHGLLLDGRSPQISLYGTKLEKLIIISTNIGRSIGITPENGDLFINQIKEKNKLIGNLDFEKNKPLEQSSQNINKIKRIELSLFVFSLILMTALLLYALYVYPQLKQNIPVSFKITGIPTRYGDKSEFLFLQIFYAILGVSPSIIVYFIIIRRYPIGTTQKGLQIMMIVALFALGVFILNALNIWHTLAYS